VTKHTTTQYRGRHRAASTSRTRRHLAVVGATVAAVTGLGAPAAMADEAQPQLPQIPTEAEIQQMVHDGALDAHDAAMLRAGEVPEQFRTQFEQGVTDLTNAVAPGALQQRADEQAAAERAAAEAAAEQAAQDAFNNTVDTPCPASAKACVDLDGRRAWLNDGGNTVYGPVYISSGAPGADTETPRGTFHVTYKVKDEVSHEFNEAPMPNSVYFTWSGHAFHQGNPNVDSAGCIHLGGNDSDAFFNQLHEGDEVFIY
jgi:lipoprotein-anchoring transpeptidase ErfK/SrfK